MIAVTDKKDRVSGATISVVVHVLLILLLLWLKLPVEDILPGEEGESQALVIDFGSTADGSGETKEAAPETPVPQDVAQASSPVQPDESSVTQNVEDVAVAMPDKKKPQEDPKPQPDQALLNVLNKVGSNKAGGGDGPGKVVGDMGDPTGTESDNYSDISGNGIKGKIKGTGRKMIGDVAIYDDSQDIGIVAVEILVDKRGKIIKADPVLMGSTTTSAHLWRKAREGLMNQILFNQSPTGEEARGTIYINFSVR